MRLPTKSEVEKATILERQVDVQEGLKLAKKVDEVRLEYVREKNNLDKFRNETAKVVQAEVDALLRKKEYLTEEIDILERHNANLKAPFDEEWERISKTRLEELDKMHEDIQKDKITTEQNKAQISHLRAEIEETKATLESRLEEASTDRLKAKNEKIEADKVLENAKIFKAEVQSRIDAENNQLAKKSEEIALQLRDVAIREAALQKSARELARRERFINSKYKVLMNTQEALKKND